MGDRGVFLGTQIRLRTCIGEGIGGWMRVLARGAARRGVIRMGSLIRRRAQLIRLRTCNGKGIHRVLPKDRHLGFASMVGGKLRPLPVKTNQFYLWS